MRVGGFELRVGALELGVREKLPFVEAMLAMAPAQTLWSSVRPSFEERVRWATRRGRRVDSSMILSRAYAER